MIAPVGSISGSAFIHEIVGDTAILHGFGDIDIYKSVEFESAVMRARKHGSRLIVDLSGCFYIDSSALRVLMRVASEMGDEFRVVVAPHTSVQRTFAVSKITMMRVLPTLEEAFA